MEGPHPRYRWGDPIPGLDRGTSSQVLTGGALGYPHPRLDGVLPISRMGYPPVQTWDRGLPPIQDWMGYLPVQTWDGGTLGYPHPKLDWVPPSRPGTGVPPSKTGWGTPVQTWDGGVAPHSKLDGIPPLPNQQSEHLLRGGRCASCVHAGVLSCYKGLGL